MADTNRDINLRIRAQDYSKKTLKELNKSIGALTKAQEDQQRAATKGEESARNLEKSYQDLERATKAAVRQVADIKAFDNQTQALAASRAATTAAQDAFEDYERTLKNTPKVTSEQTKELKRLRREMEQAEKNETRQAERYKTLETRINAYGVSSGQTKAAISQLAKMVSDANQSLERQEKAVGDNERALKALKKAEDDAAKQQLADAVDRQRKALEAVSKDAISAADGWRSIASATRQFGAAASPTTSAINSLLGVTGPMGKSIKDVSTGMRAMTNDLNSSNGAISNAKERIKELSDAQRQLGKAASLVDSYRQQIAVLRESRQEYSAAQKNVRDLAAQLVGAGDGAKDIQNKLSVAQTALGRAARSFRDNADAAHQTRDQLNQLGVSTKTMAGAESQLVSATNEVTTAQRALTSAVGRASAAAISDQSKAMHDASVEARSMAVGMKNAATSTTPVSDAIRNIIAPANQANSTLAKMEDNASLMATAFSTIRGPVQDAAKKMRDLAAAQDAIKKAGSLIDTFNRQKAAVGAARTEYRNAQQALNALSQQAAAGAISESELAAKVSSATQTVRDAAVAFRSNADAARQTRDRLREMGIDSSNASDATNRLSGAARNASRAEGELTSAIERFGKAASNAGESAKKSMLSLEGSVSKLKGEILGLTAAYTGLQGVMTLGNNVIDSSIAKQQFMSQTAVAVGKNVEEQTKQWEYINKISERWGLSVQSSSKEYSRLLVSVVKSGGSVKDAESLFEDLSIIGRANNLTVDEFNRMVYAIDQMISQGQVMTSELKLQLGNILPGIFEQAGIILHGKTEGFAAELKKGFYTSDAVFEMTHHLSDEMLDAADKASAGIIAAQNRLKNANNEFNLEVGNAGFIDKYTELLQKLTSLMRSDDGKKLAQKLGSAFATAGDAALFLAKHIDSVILVLKVLAGIMVAKAFIGFSATIRSVYMAFNTWRTSILAAKVSMQALIVSMRGANIATKALTIGMKLLGYSVPFIGWALLIWDFIAAVYEASDTFRDFCWYAIIFWKAVIDYFYNALTGAYQTFEKTINDSKDWADQQRSDEDKDRLGIKKYDQYSKEDQKKIERTTGHTVDYWQKTGDGVVPRVVTMNDDGTTSEVKPIRVTDETSRSFNEMDQRSKRFEDENTKLNEKIDREMKSQDKKTYKEMLDERIRMVKEEYEPRLKEADELADSGRNINARMEAEQTMNKAIALERKKFWNEVGKDEAEKAAKRAEKIKEIEASIQQNRDQIDSTASLKNWNPGDYADREQTYIDSQIGKYKDLEAQIRKVGGAEAERLQGMVENLKVTAGENARQTYQLQEIERYNKNIKDIEESRNARISVYKAQRDAYQLSDSEYVNKVNEAYNDSKQALLDATAAAERFGEANRNAFKTDAEYEKFKANLTNMRIETQASGNELAEYQKQAANGLAQSVNTGFSALVENITAVREGTESWSDAFQNVATAMLQYFAQLLQQIAMTIIQAAIMRALLGGAPPAAVSSNVWTGTVGTNHKGGMAGSPGIGSQRVNMASFANANRYHTGGMVGFQPDEVPIIAQEGEEVLTRDDPRNRMNGGLSGGNNDSGGIRIIAVDDQRAAATEALKTPEGQKAIISVLRGNLSTVKGMMKN